MTTNQAKPQESPTTNDPKLWLAAIKPPIYSVAVVPILAGMTVAYSEGNSFQWKICVVFLISAVFIIAWLNLSNDVFDADTGIDINKANSIVNLTGNQSLIFWLANSFLLLGCLGIVLISWWQQDPTVLVTVLVCCAFGYAYQGPPFRLGYKGLGELICFFTFGPGAVGAAYYAQTQSYSVACLAVSVLIGISTSIILFCSHFHQVKDDLAAGKKSPIVRLGTALGAKVLVALVSIFYLFAIAFMALGYLSWSVLLVGVSLPFALKLITHVRRHHATPAKVSDSKFLAVNFYLASSLFLMIGLLIV